MADTDALIQRALKDEEAEKKRKKQNKHVEGARSCGEGARGSSPVASASTAASRPRSVPASCDYPRLCSLVC